MRSRRRTVSIAFSTAWVAGALRLDSGSRRISLLMKLRRNSRGNSLREHMKAERQSNVWLSFATGTVATRELGHLAGTLWRQSHSMKMTLRQQNKRRHRLGLGLRETRTCTWLH